MPIETDIPLSIFDRIQRRTKSKYWPQHSLWAQHHKPDRTLSEVKASFWQSFRIEWSLNFSPTSRDDPFKIGLSHVMRMGKLAKAINCDLSVSGIQAFSLLVYQFSTSARQSTCLKYKPTRGTFHCLLQVFSPTAAQM